MGPSDDEISTRLADLRLRRAAIDREIADLMLYLELGRRLRGGAEASLDDPADPGRGPVPAPPDAIREGAIREGAARDGAARPPAPDRGMPSNIPSNIPSGIPPAIAFADDPAGARRYGRALIEAACAAIARAGRPLHAGEILEALLAQGFTVPGRDPVAALNTRLWKRAGPDGPLRRVGEAIYARIEDAGPA